jgi:hypothetical protein
MVMRGTRCEGYADRPGWRRGWDVDYTRKMTVEIQSQAALVRKYARGPCKTERETR